MLLDIKNLRNAIETLMQERGIEKSKIAEIVGAALASAYKKQYGKPRQIIEARFDPDTTETSFSQVKIVVDKEDLLKEEEVAEEEDDPRVHFDEDRHIMLEDALKLNATVTRGGGVYFPLEKQEEFSRIATQTARQTVMYKVREAEREVIREIFEEKEGTLTTGRVQRIERGNVYVDLGKTIAILPFYEQIKGERFRTGEQVRALILSVDDKMSKKGSFITLSRSSPEFVRHLFAQEVPEIANGDISIKEVAREPGTRTKISVMRGEDSVVDPVGAMVGQRGVRVMVVMNELRGERIDVIEWNEEPSIFIQEAFSPASVLEVNFDPETSIATIVVAEDQIPIAIGRGGQNMKLVTLLTGNLIDIHSVEGELVARTKENGEVEMVREVVRSEEPKEVEEKKEKVEEKAVEGKEEKAKPEEPKEVEEKKEKVEEKEEEAKPEEEGAKPEAEEGKES